MNQLLSSTARAILLLVIGSGYLYEYISTYDDGFLSGRHLILAPLFLLFLTVAIWSMVRDRRQYKATNAVSSYRATITAAMMTIALIIITQLLVVRDSSPVLIQAGYDGGFNGAWFEFREDGTYRYINSGGIAATTLRGTYELKDSLIILDRADLDNTLQSRCLAIRTNDNAVRVNGLLPAQILCQINEHHQVLDRELIFIVHEDHRK